MKPNRLLITMPIAMTIIIATFLFNMASGGQISPLIASTRGLFDPQMGEISEERNQEFLDARNIL